VAFAIYKRKNKGQPNKGDYHGRKKEKKKKKREKRGKNALAWLSLLSLPINKRQTRMGKKKGKLERGKKRTGGKKRGIRVNVL